MIDENVNPILGADFCVQNKIIQVNDHDRINQIQEKNPIFKEFEDVFSGLGKIGEDCHIYVKEENSPVVHASRRIPHALFEPLKKQLEELEERKIIQKVTEPTDWVSSIVLVKKPNNTVRICIDPSDLNKVIRRPYY